MANPVQNATSQPAGQITQYQGNGKFKQAVEQYMQTNNCSRNEAEAALKEQYGGKNAKKAENSASIFTQAQNGTNSSQQPNSKASIFS